MRPERSVLGGSSTVVLPLSLYNGIQLNCTAFPMMGPDLPDHNFYHGHYPTPNTEKTFVKHPALLFILSDFLLLFHGLCVVKGKKDFAFFD